MPTTPVVTYPNGGEFIVIGSTVDITWTMPAGNDTGYFKVYAWRPGPEPIWNALNSSPWLAATGATSYTLTWTVGVPADTDWRIRVYYYNPGGEQLDVGFSNSDFAVVVTLPDRPTSSGRFPVLSRVCRGM